MKRIDIKIIIIVATVMMKIMMKWNSIKEILKGAHNDTQHQNSARLRTSAIDCDGVQLTNAKYHMVPISILWYRESWTIHLKCTFETKGERITVSYHPTHHHSHTNFWHVCLLEIAYFNYMECSHNICLQMPSCVTFLTKFFNWNLEFL